MLQRLDTRFAPTRKAASRAPLWQRLAAMATLRRQRAHLAALDDHLLRDIGLTRADADHEASRPFWDAPSHWRE